jgi:hypothetical protein
MPILAKSARQICVAAFVLSLLTFDLRGQSSDMFKFSKESWRALEKRTLVIKEEIDELKSHPWAGQYFYGNGLSSFHLTVAPESGFAFYSQGCMGIYGLNFGSVRKTGSTLELLLKEPNRPGDPFSISAELILISWGDRHYLVPPSEIVEFVNAINAGFEPRKSALGRFFLKKGDEHRPATGSPNIPTEYADYLLEKPIEGKVSSVQEIRHEGEKMRSSVLLNIGKAQGVRVDMRFYLQDSSRFYAPAVITAVNDSNSVAELVQFKDSQPPSPGSLYSLYAFLSQGI